MGSDGITNATTILMEVGIACVVDFSFDPPVSSSEHQCVTWICLPAAQEVNIPLLGVLVAEVEAVAADGDQLRGKRKSE